MFFPDFLDEDLKDLIDQLLQVHPKDRLGAEIEEGKNTLEDLKAHKFFGDMVFKDIHKRSPPIPENERLTMELNQKANKVPIDLHEVDSDDEHVERPKLQTAHSNTDLGSGSHKEEFGTHSIIPTSTQKNLTFDPKLLEPAKKYDDDNIIKEAIIEKRNKWYFYQDRTLKLTKGYRLMYFKKEDYRGDITLSKKVSIRKDRIGHFDIITPNKVFHFRCKEGDSASDWVRRIKNAIKAKVEKEKADKK